MMIVRQGLTRKFDLQCWNERAAKHGGCIYPTSSAGQLLDRSRLPRAVREGRAFALLDMLKKPRLRKVPLTAVRTAHGSIRQPMGSRWSMISGGH